MEKSMPENSSKRKRVVTELIQGREFATQLQILLDNNPFRDDCSVSAEQLVKKILKSFTDSLSVLSSGDGYAGGRQIPASADVDSSFSGDRESQDSGESMKGPAAGVDRRGRYKRRKNSDSRIILSPKIEDGYAWRKYGQKDILNTKYPRCYYRCTHKHDQGCKALKQVQQIDEEDNPMFHITYFGHHACRGTKKSPQPISKKEPLESFMVNFESNKIPICNKQPVHPPLKEETNSSLDYVLWKDLMALESSDHEEDVLSGVHSCASTSSIGLDMGDLIRSVDFDNDFKFDELIEFF